MDNIALLISTVLLALAIKFHAKTQVCVIKKIDKVWYERLFSGSRPAADNLTEEGLKYRKQSNLYAIAGLIVLGLYVWLRSAQANG